MAGNLGELGVQPVPFDAKNIRNAELARRGQPRAEAASYIEYGLGTIKTKQPGQNQMRGMVVLSLLLNQLAVVEIIVDYGPLIVGASVLRQRGGGRDRAGIPALGQNVDQQ